VSAFLRDGWLTSRRWFGSKSRTISGLDLPDFALVPHGDRVLLFGRCHIQYETGDPEDYILLFGLACEPPPKAVRLLRFEDAQGGPLHLYEAVEDDGLVRLLLDLAKSENRVLTLKGDLLGERLADLDADLEALPIAAIPGEQSNTNLRLGDRYLVKLFRRYVAGPNPDYEIGRFLTQRVGFPHVPRLTGALHYVVDGAPPMTLLQVQGWVPNRGDAWQQVVAQLSSALRSQNDMPPLDVEFTLLGKRTGQLHVCLASATDDPAFAPEEFTESDLAHLVSQMHAHLEASTQLVAGLSSILPQPTRELAARFLASANRLRQCLVTPKLSEHVQKIRVHGDYHLGQVLCTTAGDFVIVDFEGEPGRSLAERRAKQCPLKDVAGMLRSFDYAAQAALRQVDESSTASLRDAVARWTANAQERFLEGYLAAANDAAFLPRSSQLRNQLLHLFVLDKALYELLYEANNRPDWIAIPLTGLLRYAEGDQAGR
jgi:trehalose synthase-fused probable maltokinase